MRGAATLKARALKEVWNIAAVIPVEKNLAAGGVNNNNASNGNSNSSFSGELVPEENFLGICSRELLARGCELLKRTRKGIYYITSNLPSYVTSLSLRKTEIPFSFLVWLMTFFKVIVGHWKGI